MALARARGKLRGKKPKLSDRQQAELCRMYDSGNYAISDLAELFSVSRPTIYRTLHRKHTASVEVMHPTYDRKPSGRPNERSREAQREPQEAETVASATSRKLK
jgi:hypothetical protein